MSLCRSLEHCCLSVVSCAAVAAQSYTCSAGAISHIECFLDDRGYISDIRYISNPFKAVTSCQSTEQQLSTSTTSDFAIAAGEYITALTICSDSAGVRGISVSTSLGQAYNCGYTAAGCVTQQGGQALGGFAATCTSSSDGLQRVLTVESPCWLPNYRPPTSPSSECWLMLFVMLQRCQQAAMPSSHLVYHALQHGLCTNITKRYMNLFTSLLLSSQHALPDKDPQVVVYLAKPVLLASMVMVTLACVSLVLLGQ